MDFERVENIYYGTFGLWSGDFGLQISDVRIGD